jgi:hypothetical protein
MRCFKLAKKVRKLSETVFRRQIQSFSIQNKQRGMLISISNGVPNVIWAKPVFNSNLKYGMSYCMNSA